VTTGHAVGGEGPTFEPTASDPTNFEQRYRDVFRAGDVTFGPASHDRIELLGLPFDVVERAAVPAAVEALIRAPGTRFVFPVNVDTLNQTQRDPWLRDVIRRGDWIYADGAGVVFGARAMGYERPDRRVTAADLVWDLAAAWQDGRYSVYFLGGEPGVAERAAAKLQERFPGFRVAGTHHGFMTLAEEEALFREIDRLAPDIVMVGYGVPLEHRLTMQRCRLTPNVGVYWMVGALTTYVAETVPRVPRWMGDAGFEWLFRLLVEPRRKWRRYVYGNPLYIGRILRERLWRALQPLIISARPGTIGGAPLTPVLPLPPRPGTKPQTPAAPADGGGAGPPR